MYTIYRDEETHSQTDSERETSGWMILTDRWIDRQTDRQLSTFTAHKASCFSVNVPRLSVITDQQLDGYILTYRIHTALISAADHQGFIGLS